MIIRKVSEHMTENKTTELKREYIDAIKNTVTAFANCDGGSIYIGINDNGSICGVEDVDSTMLRAASAIRDAIRPDVTMFTECRNETMDGKNVVVITVQRGTARPYYLAGKGIRPEGVYVRQGASTVPATESAILAMIKETSGDSYESARSLQQQLTFHETTAFFAKRDIPFGDAQMRTLHFIGQDENYTNLAFLLSDQCTHTIKMAVFEGSEKTIFKDRRELTGSLLRQLEEAYDFIDRHNRTRAEFSGLDRIDIRDYPPEAVREALLNAVVHREYSFSSSTLISIFDDRIEFVTIGGLVKGVTPEDIELGVSVLRNEHLANIFYRLKLIEAYGTGIAKIRRNYAGFTVQPKIEITNNAFKITLPNVNSLSENLDARQTSEMMSEKISSENKLPREEREKLIIELCRKNGSVTRREIQESFQISQATAILLVNKMVEKGTLQKTGTGKGVRYILK